MTKGGQSSISSAARKKQALKRAQLKAAGSTQPQEPLAREKKPKKEKGKSKEPRPKVYIPPVKPAPVQADPLDALGLASQLPSALYIVLRKLGKKDEVTKGKALEELKAEWLDKCSKEDNDSSLVAPLVTMLPVWMRHIPSLFLHPSKRIRLLTAVLHSALLHVHDIRDAMIFFLLRETAGSEEVESILGSWCLASYDIDHSVGAQALQSWTESFSLLNDGLAPDQTSTSSLTNFIRRALFDPLGLYLFLNPLQPASVDTPPRKPGARSPVVQKTNVVEQVTRSKGDGEEENVQDRKARLRTGALGALKWILDNRPDDDISEDLISILSDTSLWSSLSPNEKSPFIDVESFGFEQPGIRKSAWLLLQSLIKRHKAVVKSLLGLVSIALLRSAWVETGSSVRTVMWQPLLLFLREFPVSWELADRFRRGDESSDSDVNDDETHSAPPSSSAYRDFLRFLELGCSGSPLQGYPIVVIILSTIPVSVLKAALTESQESFPLQSFFISFWVATDGRALSSLDRAATSKEFVSSLLECIRLAVRRLSNGSHDLASLLSGPGPAEATRKLVQEQTEHLWKEVTSKRLKIEEQNFAKLLAQHLKLLNTHTKEAFLASWDSIVSSIRTDLQSDRTISTIMMVVLKEFDVQFAEETKARVAVKTLIEEVAASTLVRCEDALDNDVEDAILANYTAGLALVMVTFADLIFGKLGFADRIDALATRNVNRLLKLVPSFLLAYLSHRGDQNKCSNLWNNLLSVVANRIESLELLISLVDAAEQGKLPDSLAPDARQLDAAFSDFLLGALHSPVSEARMSFAKGVLHVPSFFLSPEGLRTVLEGVASIFASQVEHALHDVDVSSIDFGPMIDLLRTVFESKSQAPIAEAIVKMVPDVFALAYLIPKGQDSTFQGGAFDASQKIWASWVKDAADDARSEVSSTIKEKLRHTLLSTQVRLTSEDVLQVLSEGYLGFEVAVLHDIFPSREQLDVMLDDLPSSPFHSCLAVLDPFAVSAPSNNKAKGAARYDIYGFSSYSRVASALLHVCTGDRKLARENLWILRHLLALQLYANDFLHVPSISNPVFEHDALKFGVAELPAKIQQMATYLLAPPVDDNWHLRVINAIAAKGPRAELDGVGIFVTEVISFGVSHDSAREARILRTVLQQIFRNTTSDQADQWVLLARKLEQRAPQTSMAIVSSISGFAPVSTRLDRYRNELAAGLLGVPAAKANEEGALLLRKLAASVPDPDSEVPFLPQQRAINLMKVCREWIASDEDVDDELLNEMTWIFAHLIPILQNVPGNHWDLIFDVVENNFEVCSFADDSTLVTLARTLNLILEIQDIASTNRSLRTDWDGRKNAVLKTIRDLVTVRVESKSASVPWSTCRELALSVLSDPPEFLLDQDTLGNMCHLLLDSIPKVQIMAYQFLQQAARRRTEYLVIEAGVDAEPAVKVELPLELIVLMQRDSGLGNDPEQDEQDILCWLLAWLLAFDSFENASVKVRSGFIDQFRSLDIVSTHFIPNVFALLNLYGGIPKALRLDIWSVDEYYVQLYEQGLSQSLRLMAAHLYHRALSTVPSIMRSWVNECKDKQLLSTVTIYTSQHFSPVIIKSELDHVKSPENVAGLQDENMSVKVSNSVNEVKATYVVDDQPLEITLKLPSDWPLRDIEIRDERVAVNESRWRAWVFKIQQIFWTQNGHIVDGLYLFKKNISLHFQGLVECPICYSIINVTDVSLPKKPCKTCKKRFHALCLDKWFKTSHSSTCPLCRSEWYLE